MRKKEKKSKNQAISLPDNDLDLSLLLMGLLNVITVTFLTAVIVLTQYRIAFSQKAAGFMDELMVMPERPEIRIAVAGGCCILLGMCIWLKRDDSVQGTAWFSVLNVLEIVLAVFLMEKLDMAYNGILLFVFAEILFYVKKSWNRLAVLSLACFCYLICNYQLISLLVPMNSFEGWVSFYGLQTEKLFLGIRTVCELANMLFFLGYIILLIMADRKENERILTLNQQLQKANEQLHAFAQEKELMGETRERNRLAREIHDTLGHILTGISVGIDAVAILMETSPEAAGKQLETIGKMARTGLDDVRRSVRKLKPDALERLSLENAIHQMIEEMSGGTNTKIYFVSYIDKIEFESDIEEILYRIIQESTTNAIRHGKATEIWIRMSEKNGELILMISDNGCGCSEIVEGFGLQHMRERVELAGGTLYCEGNFGFTVIVKMPMRQKKTEENL